MSRESRHDAQLMPIVLTILVISTVAAIVLKVIYECCMMVSRLGARFVR